LPKTVPFAYFYHKSKQNHAITIYSVKLVAPDWYQMIQQWCLETNFLVDLMIFKMF